MATAALVTGIALPVILLIVFGAVTAVIAVVAGLLGYGCWYRMKMFKPYRELLKEAKSISKEHLRYNETRR